MRAFEFVAPTSPEAASALAEPGSQFIAGGTGLLPEPGANPRASARLIAIKSLPGTTEIRRGATWSFGANVTVSALASDPEVRLRFPALSAAAAEVGSTEVRTAVTIGGNLAQHPACSYFRHRTAPCRKKGGALCHAHQGASKHHAVFSGTPCLSPCVSNLAVAFAALGASVLLQRGRAVQRSTIAELYATAWTRATAHNSLATGDLILAVELPASRRRSTYLQVADRSEFHWPLVSCAVAAEVRPDGALSAVRIVLGAIATIPWQVDAANAFMNGKRATTDTAEKAADILLRDARPLGDNAYKLPIAKALVRRTLLALGG